MLTSTKQRLEHDIQAAESAIKTASKDLDLDLPPLPPAPITIPPSLEPYLIASVVFGVATTAVLFYRKNLRRIPSAAYLTPNMLNGKRTLKGRVTSVGDSDNFRFYHTPGGIWAGWGWLRHVPSGTKGNTYNDDLIFDRCVKRMHRFCDTREKGALLNTWESIDIFLTSCFTALVALKDQTLHIRLAGVDAPEVILGTYCRPLQLSQWLSNVQIEARITVLTQLLHSLTLLSIREHISGCQHNPSQPSRWHGSGKNC